MPDEATPVRSEATTTETTSPVTTATTVTTPTLRAEDFEQDPDGRGWSKPTSLVVLGVEMFLTGPTADGDPPELDYKIHDIVMDSNVTGGLPTARDSIRIIVDTAIASYRNTRYKFSRPENFTSSGVGFNGMGFSGLGFSGLEFSGLGLRSVDIRSPLDFKLSQPTIVALHLTYQNWSFNNLINGRSPLIIEGIDSSTNEDFSTFGLCSDGQTLFFIYHKKNTVYPKKFGLSFDVLDSSGSGGVLPVDIDPKIRNG